MDIYNISDEDMLKYHIDWARAERNRLLSESDWTQFSDVVLSEEKKQAWKEYRQSLRDLVNRIVDTSPFEWPEKPIL